MDQADVENVTEIPEKQKDDTIGTEVREKG